MNIVVLVKQVPDTWAERKLKDADGTLDRASVDGLINELDEYAIEEGLQIAEAQRGAGAEAEVTILTMGPEKAAESIRKALSMGADKAVHLLDDGLAGSDALSTSYAIAKVLEQTGFDLVICGSESTDARSSVPSASVSLRSTAVSGTCLTNTTMFMGCTDLLGLVGGTGVAPRSQQSCWHTACQTAKRPRAPGPRALCY